MKTNFARNLTIYLLLAPLLWTSGSVAQTAKTTKYTYDVFGRLTFVEDSQNGNRDYDYDNAGNRLLVAVGNASDNAASPPPLAAPSGRSKNYIANCAWRATWTLVTGAQRYDLKNTQNQNVTILPVTTSGNPGVTITGTTIAVTLGCPANQPSASEPASVKACNVEGCGAVGAF